MKVGVAGLGLIGGSLAKAYAKSGAVVYISRGEDEDSAFPKDREPR